jgi:hypothetical protein
MGLFIRLKSAIILFTLLFLEHSTVLAQPDDPVSETVKTNQQPVYTTSRLLTERPVIDGVLDDECWSKGTWAGDYHQFVPNEGAEPTYPTYLNIQYDDKYLYIAFRAYDGEPGKIIRMSGVRDELVGDMVGITFDSYRDYRTGFEFTLTAWGQKVDLVLFNPMNWDFNWNAVWKGKTGLEDSAWVAELEVPLSQLRYSKKDEQVWGMHTWRWISRLQEESNWEIQSKTGPGMLYNFGELRGISGLKQSRRLEIMPFLMGDLSTTRPEGANPFTGNGRNWGANAGLDAKIGVSSNFTIDLTINPDFGQVESDPSVMNLTAFETFYEEKRPFFLEGLTIFDFDYDELSLFYSRRIGHAPALRLSPGAGAYVDNPDKTTILSALKFSGTTSKGLSVGLIQSVTANEFARISDVNGAVSETKVEPLTGYTVARLQKGYNSGNTVIGGMLTSTNRARNTSELLFLPDNAVTGGLDLLHHWKDKEFYIDARLLGSHISGDALAIRTLQESSARYYQRPDAEYLSYDTTASRMNGTGGKIKIGKGSKGFWRYSAAFSWVSPGLELNDLGYMRVADALMNTDELSWFVNKPFSIFNTFSAGYKQDHSWNFNGTYLGFINQLNTASEFRNNWSLRFEAALYSSAIDTRRLRGGPEMLMPGAFSLTGRASTDPSEKVIFQLAGSYVKYGEGSGSVYTLEPGISVRPFSSLKLAFNTSYSENRDEIQYVTVTDIQSEKRYILGIIDQKTLGITFRADLNLSPEFSLQYYGSPFVSVGAYSGFKRITNAKAAVFSDRFELLGELFRGGETIGFDENSDLVPDYTISDPDFSFFQFRSNLVAKWEYRLGSFIYLVWSSDRTGRNPGADTSISGSFGELKKVFPDNIFLIKFNYWFSL